MIRIIMTKNSKTINSGTVYDIRFCIKFTFLTIILFLTSPIVSSALAETNLVANPSFENGGIQLLNWTFVTDSGNIPFWDTVALSGTRSVRLQIGGTIDKISGYMNSDLIRVQPLSNYTFLAWGKTKNARGTNAPAVRMVEVDANKKTIHLKTGSNTAYLYVYANIWKGYGTFWVDDVNLGLKAAPVPTPGPTLTPTPTVTPTPTPTQTPTVTTHPSIIISSLSNGLIFTNLATLPYITYDNFESGTYNLHDGDTSLNRKWKCLWNGYGSSGVKKDSTGNNIFFMYSSTSQAPDETNSSLAISTQTFSNFEFVTDVKTVRQLRQNTSPNPWEVSWIMFRFTDLTHYYYFTVKTNGIELGKYDGGQEVVDQKILYTTETPTVTIGTWSTWKINVVGNHIIVYVDGVKVVDYIDKTMSNQLKSGSIGMYNEDALVNFDNVKFRLLK
ncbi:Uncharacterised protein [uncultured archaeon]|nr:Uncharacterised protein [uncultured archaeon]